MLKASTGSAQFENYLYFVKVLTLDYLVYYLASINSNNVVANFAFANFIKEYVQIITFLSFNISDSIQWLQVFINLLISNPINLPLWTNLVTLLYLIFEKLNQIITLI